MLTSYKEPTIQRFSSYLNIVWTATMVLQSASVSSSAEFDDSLLTMTMLSARLMPARSKSSILWDHKIIGITYIHHS